jgi:hypothetical protein
LKKTRPGKLYNQPPFSRLNNKIQSTSPFTFWVLCAMLCSIEYVISSNVGKCKSNCILCSNIIKYWDLLSDMHDQSLKIHIISRK